MKHRLGKRLKCSKIFNVSEYSSCRVVLIFICQVDSGISKLLMTLL